MRNIFKILLLSIIITSCEKQSEINGVVHVMIKNELGGGEQTPKGLDFEYLKDGEIIKEECNSVGKGFKLIIKSGDRYYFKAVSRKESDVSIELIHNGEVYLYKMDYKTVVIEGNY